MSYVDRIVIVDSHIDLTDEELQRIDGVIDGEAFVIFDDAGIVEDIIYIDYLAYGLIVQSLNNIRLLDVPKHAVHGFVLEDQKRINQLTQVEGEHNLMLVAAARAVQKEYGI
mgnify:CR=1 FL=1|tara:strand:- start:274 stop:609 length:336 start_codon:yes stop_codon:yes gene_type:complete